MRLAPQFFRPRPSAPEAPSVGEAVEVVQRYLDCVVRQDWSGAEVLLSPEVVRIGPFGDTFTPREPYLAHLAEVMPTLQGYSMQIYRVVAAGRIVLAELSETVEVDGRQVTTPEVIVFDLDTGGLITRVAIYLQQLGRR
jgi:hypothetical protein